MYTNVLHKTLKCNVQQEIIMNNFGKKKISYFIELQYFGHGFNIRPCQNFER